MEVKHEPIDFDFGSTNGEVDNSVMKQENEAEDGNLNTVKPEELNIKEEVSLCDNAGKECAAPQSPTKMQEGKPYACTICEFKTAYKGNLKDHMKIHTQSKPYACSVCGYRAIRNQHLKYHMKTHAKRKLYTCIVCGCRMVDPENFKYHLQTHTERKLYACNVCDYRTVHKESLKWHIKTHS